MPSWELDKQFNMRAEHIVVGIDVNKICASNQDCMRHGVKKY